MDKVFIELINFAAMAPSGCNAQPWRFIVVKNKTTISKLKKAVIKNNPNPVFYNKFCTYHDAPYLIAVCVDLNKRWYHRADPTVVGKIEDVFDNPDFFSAAAAIQNLFLAANAFKIGTCWGNTNSCYRREQEKILGIEPPLFLAAIIAVGYYDIVPEVPVRKSMKEISSFIS